MKRGRIKAISQYHKLPASQADWLSTLGCTTSCVSLLSSINLIFINEIHHVKMMTSGLKFYSTKTLYFPELSSEIPMEAWKIKQRKRLIDLTSKIKYFLCHIDKMFSMPKIMNKSIRQLTLKMKKRFIRNILKQHIFRYERTHINSKENQKTH